MFDINTINKRYFELHLSVALEESEDELDFKLFIEPPKVKTLKKIAALSKIDQNEAMDETIAAFQKIVNKNKNHQVVSDEVIENLDFDEVKEILAAYFAWLTQEKNSKN